MRRDQTGFRVPCRKSPVQPLEDVLESTRLRAPSLDFDHTAADFLFPGGLGFRRETGILIRQLQENACQREALRRRKFQRVLSQFRNRFHTRKLRLKTKRYVFPRLRQPVLPRDTPFGKLDAKGVVAQGRQSGGLGERKPSLGVVATSQFNLQSVAETGSSRAIHHAGTRRWAVGSPA